MAGHSILGFGTLKESPRRLTTRPMPTNQKTEGVDSPTSSSEHEEPMASPGKMPKGQAPTSPTEGESFFNSFNSLRSSRANSVYSLSRISLSSQLSQLTALALPNPTSLSTSISSIPTAPLAATTLENAADQIKRWLNKATDVLNGLDAEDDVEWAAAGGREGLGELDAAIGKFEGLIGVYVSAIENLQGREDIPNVPAEQLKGVVAQMESLLKDWENVKRSMKSIKGQVELAMEWEELWNVVLGDIGLEMDNLSSLVFEMEEARHKALLSDPMMDGNAGLDIQELGTIIEEGEKESLSHRFSLPASIAASSPVTSPTICIAPDDTRLLALFARMQPLRASLDFLPMTLDSFKTRAEGILPSACQELQSRAQSLEKKWKRLESDAEGLRQELGEDRWVAVFRNAARQAQKMCESVERAITKLQESIDAGNQHSNPPLLAKKVEAYEAKNNLYGPSIEKILGIIDKGVNDRLTVNGEILRLQSDTKARWASIKADIKDMDLALDDLTMNKNQQLRDSISSIVTMDRSASGSGIETPGSSPASSVVMGPTNGSKKDPSPGMNGPARRSSISTSRQTGSKRFFTMPPGAVGSSHLPRKPPVSRSFTSDPRDASPSPYAKQQAATPAPGSRTQRPSLSSVDNKPRWNSSPKVDYFEFGQKPRPLPFSTPSTGRRSSMAFRSLSSTGANSTSGLPLPSPLGRSSPAFSPPSGTPSHRHRMSAGAHSFLGRSQPSSSPPANSTDWVKVKDKALSSLPSTKRQSIGLDAEPETPPEDSPSIRPRPSTSLASSRRISMLPLPKSSLPPLTTPRDDITGIPSLANHGRQSSLGLKTLSHSRDGSTGPRPPSKGKDSGATRQARA